MSVPPDDADARPDSSWPRWTHVTSPLPALNRMRLPRLAASRPAVAATAAAAALVLAGVAWVLPAGSVPFTGRTATHTGSGVTGVPGPAVTRTRPGPAILLPGTAVPGPAVTRTGAVPVLPRAGPGSTVTAAATRTAPGSTVTAAVTRTAPGQDGTVTETGPGATRTVTATVTATVPGPAETVTATETVTVPPGHSGPAVPAPGSGPPG
jgi:hypothetical protein